MPGAADADCSSNAYALAVGDGPHADSQLTALVVARYAQYGRATGSLRRGE